MSPKRTYQPHRRPRRRRHGFRRRMASRTGSGDPEGAASQGPEAADGRLGEERAVEPLRRRADFEQVFAVGSTGERVARSRFACSSVARGPARVGFAIGKRLDKRAVVRNPRPAPAAGGHTTAVTSGRLRRRRPWPALGAHGELQRPSRGCRGPASSGRTGRRGAGIVKWIPDRRDPRVPGHAVGPVPRQLPVRAQLLALCGRRRWSATACPPRHVADAEAPVALPSRGVDTATIPSRSSGGHCFT